MNGMRRYGFFLSLLLVLALVMSLSCAKSSGDDDDDDDDNDDDNDDDDDGVDSLTVSLNMVPVVIGDVATAQTRTVYDAEGDSFEVESVLLTEYLEGITAFADDKDKFTYEFVNQLEDTAFGDGEFTSLDDYATAAFYVHPEDGGLCIGWTDQARANASLCNMAGGWIVTHPIDGAFDIKPISYVTERSGDDPAHLNEEVAVTGVITLGTGVMVSGSYMKTYLQADGNGVKLFADMSATEETMGYDGSLFSDIFTFQGDEVFVKGTVTVHDSTIEFIPVSGYHLAVLSRSNEVDAPVVKTIEQLGDDHYASAGSLVRINGVEMTDIDPEDATTDWPEYGTKSKGIRIRTSGSAGLKIGMPVYEGTGIPGSFKPSDGFNVVGVLDVAGVGLELFPRMIEDINPVDDRLAGDIRVSVTGESKVKVVDLADLVASANPITDGGEPVTMVSLASVARAAGILRNPKLVEYKPVAWDGRTPFETALFDEIKSGILYQQTPSSEEEPDPMVGSYFWEGMGLSPIYYLDGVTEIQAFRNTEGPQEGDAEHGEGVTLIINGVHFAVNFDTLTRTEYEGAEAIAMSQFINEQVISMYSMNGSFTTDQIRSLYDYRLISFDEATETIVRLDDIADGYLVMDDPPYTVFPSLGDAARVDDLFVIDMMRYIQVDMGEGDPDVIYLRDLNTQSVDVGDGVMEDVVFFGSILEEAGFDTMGDTYLYNFWLRAADDFTSIFPYEHNHLSDMYFRPFANRGYTVDSGLGDYGGRVSTKAVYEIELHDVPQEAPSIPVMINDQTLWGYDAETCEGCHYSHEQISIPIDCYSCHDAPTL